MICKNTGINCTSQFFMLKDASGSVQHIWMFSERELLFLLLDPRGVLMLTITTS